MSNRDMSALSLQKFGVGQPVPRSEDPKLLRGEGRYTDDINLPGQLYAYIVRSRYAHGTIRAIDTAEAKAMPGVLGVYTGADLAAKGYGTLKCMIPLPNRDGSPMNKPPRYALPTDKVRFVGDPVAVVVADTFAQAKDAGEAVMVDIDPLPVVTDAKAAAAPEAPLLYAEAPGNICLDYHFGDTEKVNAAFAKAAHITKLDLLNNRLVVSAMEPRAAIGVYDKAADHWTLHSCSQGVFGLRNQLANDILGVKPDKVRVLTGNVGGSFGMKASVYPEHVCILHASRELGRPVKWTDERADSFLSDQHGRDHQVTAELALDAEGHFLAVRLTGFGNMGAYLGTVAPMMPTLNTIKNVVGVYRTPAVEISAKCVFTNTSPVSAYRGAGRPEGNYYMERLVDAAAAEMGIDRIELRRRNHIAPAQIPYTAPSSMVYDSGDFRTVLDKALQAADWDGFAARQADSRKRGKLRGRGLASFLEVTAPQNKEMSGLRFEADGTVTFITGTLDYGQGHASTFAQVLHDKLGIPFDRIRLLQGDSDEMLAGAGTGGSRSAMNSSAAAIAAGDTAIENGKKIASVVLEAAVADIEFADGRFTIAGTDRAIGIMELAEKLRGGLTLPPDVPASLNVKQTIDGVVSTFPNGCHVAEVEIDPETGVVEVVKYSTVNDFGTLLNPMLVAGQVHGGVVQGIGQALMERTVYNEDGQPVTGSYMDYAVPRADDTPFIEFASHAVPATSNPLGVKGCGEAGCAGALPSVMNAVVDALSVYGITHINMPATPHAVWQAIQAKKSA